MTDSNPMSKFQSEEILFSAEHPVPTGSVSLDKRKFLKENRRHTSTKFFVMWKTSRTIFRHRLHSVREEKVLSSGGVVTATRVVQKCTPDCSRGNTVSGAESGARRESGSAGANSRVREVQQHDASTNSLSAGSIVGRVVDGWFW